MPYGRNSLGRCGADQEESSLRGPIPWTVIRTGADIKIRCNGCGHIVMMEREVFLKRRKKVLQQGPDRLPGGITESRLRKGGMAWRYGQFAAVLLGGAGTTPVVL